MSLSDQQLGGNNNDSCCRYRAGSRRWSKNQMSRRIRRASKRDPENAPRRKRFRGWP